MHKFRLALACSLLLLAVGASAQQPDDKKPPEKDGATHDEIRAMRDSILKAIEKKDVDALVAHLHPEVVLTLQDGKELVALRKHDGVRDYLKRTITGPNPSVKEFSTEVTVDELTLLHGDSTGVAFGSSRDRYVLADGSRFDVPTRWSATMVRHDGKWKVASLQVSANPFDNAVLDSVARRTYWMAAAAAGVGLLVGFVAMMFLRPAAKPATQAGS